VVDAIQSAGAAGFRVHFIGVEVERAKNARQIIASVQATGGKYYDVSKEEQLLQAYFDIDRQEKARFVSPTEVKNVPNYAPLCACLPGSFFAAQAMRMRDISLRSAKAGGAWRALSYSRHFANSSTFRMRELGWERNAAYAAP
jgi:hypothetical protein